MKKVLRVGCVFFLSLLLMSTVAWGQQVPTVKPESVGISSQMLGNIDKLAEKALKDKLIKGAVVLVARHGRICYFKAFGDATKVNQCRLMPYSVWHL